VGPGLGASRRAGDVPWQIDSYLFDPAGEVERWLHLPVGELLAEWASSQPPHFEAVRIAGLAGQVSAHELRDFFTRGAIRYRFHAAATEAGQAPLAEVGQDGSRLLVLVFYTGQVLVEPSNAEIAEQWGSAAGRPREPVTSPSWAAG
jgi:thioredoxin reductase (NADPH)